MKCIVHENMSHNQENENTLDRNYDCRDKTFIDLSLILSSINIHYEDTTNIYSLR